MCIRTTIKINSNEDFIMSQHPEQKSEKSSTKSQPGKASNVKSGHGNARESGRKGGDTTHGRN